MVAYRAGCGECSADLEETGIPLIAPVELFGANPPGREPAVMLQLYGAVPPEAASVAL